jgi:gliding motility-associated-like protein
VVSGITAPTNFVVTYSESISPYGCYNIDSVTIGLHAPVGLEAGPDTSVISGASVQLQATGGAFTDYLWEPDTWLDIHTVANPLATPMESIRYRVTATNEYGCSETDSLYIEVIEGIHVYNVFSPNGDGINEYFEIENADRYPEILVEVYSRWGDLFFSSVGYDSSKRWDGRTRGTEAPVGTYYYIIIPEPGAKPITGHVTIIR